jgi:hypothetical protein
MKILLLHPDDSPQHGPWTESRWDVVVDLGQSSESTLRMWKQQLHCPVLRLERNGIDDLKIVSEIMAAGRGRLLDAQGLDWWDLTSLLIHQDLEAAISLQRILPELRGAEQIYASRSDWRATALAAMLNQDLQTFNGERALGRLRHYHSVLRNFSLPQIAEIFFDKYDAGYKWRSKWETWHDRASNPTVLVPSAYSNVSRMAAAYARMLPDQSFLFVATRRSALQFDPPPNVVVSSLSSYATGAASPQEYSVLLNEWASLLQEMRRIPEFELLRSLGRVNSFPALFRQGLAVRNAWRAVFENQPIASVFCGDDSNRYTRIAILLAKRRGLPTVDFHHGALDGRFMFKQLPSDVYLAKSEMERDYLVRVCGLVPERVVSGAPDRRIVNRPRHPHFPQASQIVFFSEPYENSGARPQEIYRELLVPLASLARRKGVRLVIKLHPFETIARRKQIIDATLPAEDRSLIEIASGPLAREMLLKTWFGVTVESTAALDCTLQGVPCFLCEWIVLSSFGYVQQFARFGAGIALRSPEQLGDIPAILELKKKASIHREGLWRAIEPAQLRRHLLGLKAVVDSNSTETLNTLQAAN